MVITSPNMDYVPQYPVERILIQTFSDGRWGVHEYSRHPQMLLREMMHVACIPRQDDGDISRAILWANLHPTTHWKEDLETGVKGLGYLDKDTRSALTTVADMVSAKTEFCCVGTEATRAHGRLLRLLLGQVVDRMTQLPSPPGIAIAVGAHVQRLCLELEGILTYLNVVQPRLNNPDDFSKHVLPVLGTFVREGTDAQTCVRIGLPTWFLQTLTHQVPIWKVVSAVSATQTLPPSQPPIIQNNKVVAGILNLTGNWLSVMSMSVSKQVCSSRLPEMPTTGGESLDVSKRPRSDTLDMRSKHLVVPAAAVMNSEEPPKKKKKVRGGKRARKGAGAPHEGIAISNTGESSAADGGAGQPGAEVDRRAAIVAHPSRSFVFSPFYSVPDVWRCALEKVSPIPQPTVSVVYYYPPPFLLDTVSSISGVGRDCPRPECARYDEKVHRYLHNLVRIRRFCRARLFDPSMSSHPLTIAEWRAALWGDYEVHTHPAGGQTDGDVRRAEKRQAERNGISRLLGRAALLPSYRPDFTTDLAGLPISAMEAATSLSVRHRLLWEAHEINYRCELMALDTALVQRPTWTEMNRWEREALVSSVWGSRSSVVSVIPPADITDAPFCWTSPPDPSWTESRRYLTRLLAVMTRWPDTPQFLVDADVEDETCSANLFEYYQREAVEYYVRTFVSYFHRLPIPPICIPSSCMLVSQ